MPIFSLSGTPLACSLIHYDSESRGESINVQLQDVLYGQARCFTRSALCVYSYRAAVEVEEEEEALSHERCNLLICRTAWTSDDSDYNIR